ncbi:MAG: hypothetical protein HQM04_16635 [Magnetococcales bacterium]|nr:hypothetical protein [Magnetococcales bacterium]
MNALDFNHAYRVEAVSIGDRIGLFSGAQSPTGVDTSGIPVGSAYFQTDGTLWSKTGTGSSGWMKLSTLPFFFFVLADSTVVFIPWVSAGEIPLVLANGTTATLTVDM